jgi:hypothetical protein
MTRKTPSPSAKRLVSFLMGSEIILHFPAITASLDDDLNRAFHSIFEDLEVTWSEAVPPIGIPLTRRNEANPVLSHADKYSNQARVNPDG